MRIGSGSSEGSGLVEWLRAGARAAIVLGIALGLAGCEGAAAGGDAGMVMVTDGPPIFDAPRPAPAEPEIAGRYDEGMFSTHTIAGDRWTMEGMDFMAGFTLTVVNNDEDWAVARNDATNAFNPGLFSRFEWVMAGTDLYYCQAVFDAADEAAALSAARPDRATPAASGCGGFPWSLLVPIER